MQLKNSASKAMNTLSTATKGTTITTQMFGKALLATGLGAIVIALGFVIAQMLKMQPVIDKVNSVLIPLGNVMERIVGLAQNLGTTFINIFKGTASWSDLKKGVQGVGDELAEAYKEGQRLAKIAIEIAELRNDLVIKEAELAVQYENQRELLMDVTKSDKERKEAGLEALRIKEEEISGQRQMLSLQIEQLEIKLKQNDTDREAQYELNKLIAQRIKLEADANKESIRIKNTINSIDKKTNDEAVARAKEAKQKELERLEEIKAINRTAQEAIEYEQAQKIKSLGLDKDINKLTTEELMALNKINDAYDEQIAKLNKKEEVILSEEDLMQRRLVSMELQMLKELDLVRGNKDEELRIFTQFEEQKKAEREKYLQEQIQQLQNELEPIFADSGDAIGNTLGLTPEEVAKKEALLLQLKKSLNDLTPAVKEAPTPKQPQISTLQEMLGLDEEGVTNLFTTLGAVQNALNDLGNLMGSITERNKKNIQSQVKEGLLSQEQADKQVQELERKAFQRQKRLSISQALVNGALAITRILADVPKVDFGISTGILIGSAVATTATQVGAISAQKFATGGYVSGKGTATSDSIPAMLSNGEYVINAGAVQTYGSGLMDMINSFQFPKFATGGLVAPAPIPSQQSRIQEVGQSIQDQVVEVINVESSFTNTQNKVRNVERASTF